MIEQIVYFVLGFVIAGLLGLLFLPIASRRAQRLALAQLEKHLPLNLDEIEADRDILRARFAVQNRELEVLAEEARSHRAADAAELGRRAVALARATEQWGKTSDALNERNAQLAQSRDFGEKTAASLAAEQLARLTIESELNELRQQHGALSEAHEALQNKAQTQETRLAGQEAHLATLQKAFDECKAGREAESIRAERHKAEERRLAEALAESERRNAAFEARRVRLLAKIAAERARGDEFETLSLSLRRALAEALAHQAPQDGQTAAAPPDFELLELREAISKIGHQVAHLDTAHD